MAYYTILAKGPLTIAIQFIRLGNSAFMSFNMIRNLENKQIIVQFLETPRIYMKIQGLFQYILQVYER